MKRAILLIALLACGAPTDNQIQVPASIAQLRIVHPRTVTVVITPKDTAIQTHSSGTLTARAYDGYGRLLIAAGGWKWSAYRQADTVYVTAVAYPPWMR